MRAALLFLLLPPALVLPSTALGIVIYVEADGSGDVPTIADAFAIAVPGDVISLGEGVFYEHDLTMKTSVALVSASGDPGSTAIDAQGLGRCLVGISVTGAPRVEGITFQNGAHASQGGLLLAGHNNARFSDCVFLDGSSARGGAVALTSSSQGHAPQFARCRFESNSASVDGGALWTNGVGIADDCEFVGNEASGHGGAVYQEKVAGWGMWLDGCTFEHNGAGGDGGAVCSLGGGPFFVGTWLTSCEFRDNTATNGGAAYLSQYDNVSGCVLIGNEASARGGALFLLSVIPDKEFFEYAWNTVARNRAGIAGGALALSGGRTEINVGRSTFALNDAPAGAHFWSDEPSSWAVLRQCILAFGVNGGAAAGTGTMVTTCSDVFGNASGDWVGPLSGQEGGTGNFSEDPLFCDAEADDYTLREDSPCAIPPGGCPPGNIGAHGIGCGTTSVPDLEVVPATWGKIKAAYRE